MTTEYARAQGAWFLTRTAKMGIKALGGYDIMETFGKEWTETMIISAVSILMDMLSGPHGV